MDLQTLSVTEAVDFEVRLVDFLAVFGSGYGRVRAGVNGAGVRSNPLLTRAGASSIMRNLIHHPGTKGGPT